MKLLKTKEAKKEKENPKAYKKAKGTKSRKGRDRSEVSFEDCRRRQDCFRLLCLFVLRSALSVVLLQLQLGYPNVGSVSDLSFVSLLYLQICLSQTRHGRVKSQETQTHTQGEGEREGKRWFLKA